MLPYRLRNDPFIISVLSLKHSSELSVKISILVGSVICISTDLQNGFMKRYKVLVVGCGSMGTSHAKAYLQLPSFEIVGLVSRNPTSREKLSKTLGGLPTFSDFEKALQKTSPDLSLIHI